MIILVYLCMGLQVVSIDIPVVKESERTLVPVSASMKDALDSGWKPHMVRS